jgi:hypothetical protein
MNARRLKTGTASEGHVLADTVNKVHSIKVADGSSVPYSSPARDLSLALSIALIEQADVGSAQAARWSPRRALAFIGLSSALLWGLALMGIATLLG